MKIPSPDERERVRRATAELLVAGDGIPRTRDQLVRAVQDALARAWEEGAASARPEARRAALREVAALVEGFKTDLSGMARRVGRELDGET